MTDRSNKDTVLEETMRAGVYRRRRVDLLETWLRKGVVDDAQYAAGGVFRSYFERSRMRDRYSSMRMERSGLESAQGPDVEGYIEARDEVRGVMALLGSSMGPVVWDVCGNGISLRQHVDHVAGRSVPEAKGRLIAGLDLMARHWKLDDG